MVKKKAQKAAKSAKKVVKKTKKVQKPKKVVKKAAKAKKPVAKPKKAVQKVKKAAKAKKPMKKAVKPAKKPTPAKNVAKKLAKPAQKAPAAKNAVKKVPAVQTPTPKKIAHTYMRAPVIPVRQPTAGGATKLAMPIPASDRPVGVITHYYDKIGVGVLKLREPLKIGEMIRVQKGEFSFTQAVTSMQIKRQKVQQANANDDVALKVEKPAHEGARIYRA